MKNWIIEKYDWFIYRITQKPLHRMCRRNGGFAYLFELSLRKWGEENPISPELKSSTEQFFRAMYDERQ